jgi:hypothetical protein
MDCHRYQINLVESKGPSKIQCPDSVLTGSRRIGINIFRHCWSPFSVEIATSIRSKITKSLVTNLSILGDLIYHHKDLKYHRHR